MRAAGWLCAAALALAACAAPATGPPELRLGEDECTTCRMIVSDRSTAALARGPAGEQARFDDLACLRAFATDAAPDWRLWVWTDDTGSWTDARAARYARDARRITPMGSGLLATAKPDPTALSWPEFLHSSDDASRKEASP